MKKNNLKHFFTLTIVALAFVFYFNFSYLGHAGMQDNVSGFAWGADDGLPNTLPPNTPSAMTPLGGMGWLSFNCTGESPACANDYGVNVNDNTGDMTGYAWSSNYGWLQFGNLSGFPTGAGTIAANAKLDLSTNKVSGWARFCSGAASPANCTGTVSNSSNGGWDGWVSLSGTGYGVTYNTVSKNFQGYAWGGPDVVGWINFSAATPFPYAVSYKSLNQAVTLTANGIHVVSGVGDSASNPVVIASGAPINLAWVTKNMNICTAVSTTDSTHWSGAKSVPSGTEPAFSVVNTTSSPIAESYALNCNGPANTIGVDTVYVSITPAPPPAPTLTFYADNSTVYSPNYQTTLHWSSNVAISGCVADSSHNTNTVSTWNGSLGSVSSKLVDVPYSPTRYDITCNYTDTATNTVKTITASPVYLNRGTVNTCSDPVATNYVAGGNGLGTCNYSCLVADTTTYNPSSPQCYCPTHKSSASCSSYCSINPTLCNSHNPPHYQEN
jgi:hypothetical protein